MITIPSSRFTTAPSRAAARQGGSSQWLQVVGRYETSTIGHVPVSRCTMSIQFWPCLGIPLA